MGEKPTAVGLFAGAGGMAVGMEQAGYNIQSVVDIEEYCCDTLENNFDCEVVQADLSTADYDVISPDTVDVVTGGPPCQDFSVANRFSRGGEKTNLVFVFADWVNYLSPDVFVMENVVGMESTNNVLDNLLSEFSSMGYSVQNLKLNAKDFGVPQHRERIILVGSKVGDIEPPIATVDEYTTVGEALDTYPSVAAGETDGTVINHRAPNHQQKTVDKIAGTGFGEQIYESWGSKIRLDPNDVAPTLKAGQRANYHFAHPYDDRGLTIRERAEIMSFPETFEFCGTVTEMRTQTGNAIPPNMAKEIMDSVKNVL